MLVYSKEERVYSSFFFFCRRGFIRLISVFICFGGENIQEILYQGGWWMWSGCKMNGVFTAACCLLFSSSFFSSGL